MKDSKLSPNELLIKSAETGFVKGVQLALEKGANVHAVDDWALRYASNRGHSNVVKMLLKAGADVHAGNDYALRWATFCKHTEVINLLKKWSNGDN